MILKLLPEQIAAYWDAIKYGTQSVLPPYLKQELDTMPNILQALMSGKMTCWAGFSTREDGFNEFIGVMLTEIGQDDIAGQKFLHIYAIYAFKTVEDQLWEEGMKALGEFAAANQCKKIVAYSNNERLINMLERKGFSVDFKYITLTL